MLAREIGAPSLMTSWVKVSTQQHVFGIRVPTVQHFLKYLKRFFIKGWVHLIFWQSQVCITRVEWMVKKSYLVMRVNLWYVPAWRGVGPRYRLGCRISRLRQGPLSVWPMWHFPPTKRSQDNVCFVLETAKHFNYVWRFESFDWVAAEEYEQEDNRRKFWKNKQWQTKFKRNSFLRSRKDRWLI